MSLSKFQILDLPFVAMQHVTSLMDPIDILDLSLCSKKARKCALMHRLHSAHCNLVMKTTFDKKVCVEVVFSEHVKLTWMFVKEFNEKKMIPGEEMTARTVDETELKTSCKNTTTNTMITFDAPLDSSLELVTSYLLFLFPCSIRCIELDIKFFTDLSSISNWGTLQKCETLKLRAVKTTKEEVECVLSNISGFKNLDVIGFDGKDIVYEKMTELNGIKLNDATWFPQNKIFEFSGKRIELGENEYTPSTMNDFIKKWLRKEVENLDFLTIHMEHIPQEDVQQIFDDIETEEWNSNSRHGYFRKDSVTVFDCRNGRDILRDDGKLATVLFANYSFNFLVWHTRHPDFTLPRGMFYNKNPKQPILEAEYFKPVVYQTVAEAEREIEFIS